MVAPEGTPFACGNCYVTGHLSAKCNASTQQLLNRSQGVAWGKFVATKPAQKTSVSNGFISDKVSDSAPEARFLNKVNTKPVSVSLSQYDVSSAKDKDNATILMLPDLPPLILPKDMDEEITEALHFNRNCIQDKLNSLTEQMKFIEQNTRHTRSTDTAWITIQGLREEIEVAILAYVSMYPIFGININEFDPTFNYEPTGMDQTEPYLEALEERSLSPTYGVNLPPPPWDCD